MNASWSQVQNTQDKKSSEPTQLHTSVSAHTIISYCPAALMSITSQNSYIIFSKIARQLSHTISDYIFLNSYGYTDFFPSVL